MTSTGTGTGTAAPAPAPAPAAPAAPAPAAPAPAVVLPRVGGDLGGLVWVGGPNGTRLTRPTSMHATRADDPKALLKVLTQLGKGLGTDRRLNIDKDNRVKATNGVTLTQWVKTITKFLQQYGADTVFYVCIDIGTAAAREVNILTNWFAVTEDQVKTWVCHLRAGTAP